ncbi:hypothetical protein [Azonexus hydrophilus]|uniref:hypothetical protein n=1 Tax=Azonexus hydrophilus TaxID=418702 RepID=UPI00248FE4B6|nr:hypothetical protein [Azonexus hydrophilus]
MGAFCGSVAERLNAPVLKAVATLRKPLNLFDFILESPQLAEIISATQAEIAGKRKRGRAV